MNLRPSQLSEQGYHELATYSFDELIEMIGTEVRRRTAPVLAFWVLLALTLIAAIVANVVAIRTDGWYTLSAPLLAIAGLIAVIPVHELLHAAAFRIAGARRIRFGAKPKYLIFYAIAREFVADYREMRFILYLPAVVISAALVGIGVSAGPLIRVSAWWLLFFHMSACAGDFGLASFMRRHVHLGIVTGDDADDLITRFYVRTPKHGPSCTVHL